MKKSAKPKAPWVGMKGAIQPNQPRMSPSKATMARLYKLLADAFKREHPYCAVCLMDPAIGPMNVSATRDVHHIKGRVGGLLFDVRWWLAVCGTHHQWIHDNPKQACEKGYLAPEGWRYIQEKRNDPG